MGFIRQYIGGNIARGRKGGASIVREMREKCDRCSSFLTQPPTPVGPIDLAPGTSSECNHGLNSPRFISRSHVQSLCYASILGEATKHFSKW